MVNLAPSTGSSSRARQGRLVRREAASVTCTVYSDQMSRSIDTTGGIVSSTDDYIKKIVDSAPPLTPEQRNRLAVLLRPKIRPQPDEVK